MALFSAKTNAHVKSERKQFPVAEISTLKENL